MPSPFPGMDPYLEGPFWSVVHANLTEEIARQLVPLLRPRYLALVQQRFVITMPRGNTTATMIPDLGVAEGKGVPSSSASAVTAAPLNLVTVMPESVPHRTLEIRDVAERRFVTAIEVLSSTNKRGLGRREYLRKRQRILMSSAHLLEIDFLRRGRRVPMRQPLPAAPYFVLRSRAELRPLLDVWPIGLREPLPVVSVPLLPGDADIPLDLGLAMKSIYDFFGYDQAINYSGPPNIPLAAKDAAWAEERIHAWRAK